MVKASQHYERALAEMQENANPDLDSVRTSLETAISEGDINAMYALASWYLNGKHVSQDVKLAVKLLVPAADGGSSAAQFDLAVCFEKGNGVRQSNKKAAELYIKSALNGDVAAAYEVGRLYHYGIGVKTDRRIANIWFDYHKTNFVGE